MILKLGIVHWGLKLYKVYINDDLGLTMTYFKARSKSVAYAFELGKRLQSNLMGKLAGNNQIDRRFMLMKNFQFPQIHCWESRFW